MLSLTIRTLDTVSQRTGHEADYAALSECCHEATRIHEASSRFFAGLVEEVRDVCAAVKKRAPAFFRTLFYWAHGRQASRPDESRQTGMPLPRDRQGPQAGRDTDAGPRDEAVNAQVAAECE